MTSGATGEPKMGLVTHKAVVVEPRHGSLCASASVLLTLRLVFLPSAHIAQRVVIELLPDSHCYARLLFRGTRGACRMSSSYVRPTVSARTASRMGTGLRQYLQLKFVRSLVTAQKIFFLATRPRE